MINKNTENLPAEFDVDIEEIARKQAELVEDFRKLSAIQPEDFEILDELRQEQAELHAEFGEWRRKNEPLKGG